MNFDPWVFKKRTVWERRAERCWRRTGIEAPGGERPYSSSPKLDPKQESKEKKIIKMKKCCSKSRRDEARRAPLAVSHTHQPAVGSKVACGSSAGTGKRGSDRCMPLTRIRAWQLPSALAFLCEQQFPTSTPPNNITQVMKHKSFAANEGCGRTGGNGGGSSRRRRRMAVCAERQGFSTIRGKKLQANLNK